MEVRILSVSIMKTVLIFACNASYAYETPTHAQISLESIRRSDLYLDKNLLVEIGLQSDIGIDQSEQSQTFPSEIPADENNPQADHTIYQQASITRIIAGGSVIEDVGRRSLQHFFDPLHNRPLYPAPLFQTVHRSLDWILEIDEFGERVEITKPEQKYSYADAIDYFHNALTRPKETDRKENFGLMFRSLGHVIHHIQDMAQPQHTRNDAHCSSNLCKPALKYNPSLYERYTDDIRGEIRNGALILKSQNFYPIVNFDNVRNYWSSMTGAPNLGSGMADFSNINFVSQGTNFELLDNGEINIDAEYPLPVPNVDLGAPRIVELNSDGLAGFFTDKQLDSIDCLNIPDLNTQCKIEFYPVDIMDNNLGGIIETNNWASSLSIFDKELMDSLQSPEFTLNRINFEKGFYPYLIPRAVAYGAGLINHFFRGRLAVENVSLNGAGKLEFIIKNRSKNYNGNDTFTKGKLEGSGTFSVYYDNAAGNRMPLGSMELMPSEVLGVDETKSIVVDYPADIDPDKEKPFTIVYRGKIGQEEGIAAVVAPNVELNGFLVNASYTPTDGFPGYQRLLTQVDGVWKSIPFPTGRAGNVDWKGQYVNGQPAKVLTWDGEPSRYFPVGSVKRSYHIYQGGRPYARMPCPVLGAAIRKDTQNQEWIIAICATTQGVRVMERPNTRNLSNAQYNAVTAPEGWRMLGEYGLSPEWHVSWFFNGSGTAAQTVVRVYTSEPQPFHLKVERIKMVLKEGVAEFNVAGSDYPTLTVTHNCTSSCTDLKTGADCEGIVEKYQTETFLQQTESSQYTIAVDYGGENGNDEIIGMVINHTNYQRNSSSQATGDSAAITANAVTKGKKQLRFGSKLFDLINKEGSFRTTDASLMKDPSGSYITTSSLQESSLYEEHNIIYLDLRAGTVMSEDIHYANHWQGSKGAADKKYVETVEGGVFYRALANSGENANNTGKIFEVVYGPEDSGRSGPVAGEPINAGLLCNIPEDRVTFEDYPEPVNSYIEASAAVDANNRAAMSLFITNNLTASHLEQLDTEQLKILIPGAPENPSYDIRVIR